MNAPTKPEALITSPADVLYCPTCDTYGAERFSPDEFAHCPHCGSTELLDCRSVFEVLIEAKANQLAAVTLTDEASAYLRMGRMDVVFRVKAIADAADPAHCEDCRTNARRAGYRVEALMGL